jgi:gliding motility-associated-like protein
MNVRKKIWLIPFLLFYGSIAIAQNHIFAQLSGTPVNTTGWNLQGGAYPGNISGNSEIILTNTNNSQSGAIFFNQAINLSQCTRWTVEYDFRMNGGSMADGIAFCFLDVPPVGFVTGGGLGIPATANGLKVCFDTYNNCNESPTTMPKIEIRWGPGYNECSTQPTLYNSGGNLSFLRSPNYNRARIEYNNGLIEVFVNNTLYLTGFQAFNFTGYFGFTASTGGLTDNHTIKNVIIYTNMPASEAGNNVTMCSGSSINIGTSAAANYNYQWSPAAGLSDVSSSNPALTFVNTTNMPQTHTYYVSTSFSDGTGCASSDSIKITVLPQPVININPATVNICSGSNASFYTTTNISNQNLVYAWLVNGAPAGSNSPDFSAANFMNGDEVKVVLQAPGCQPVTSNAVIVNVKPLLAASVSITSDKTNICKGMSVVFTAAASPAPVSYQWKKNGIDVGLNAPTYSDNTLENGDVMVCQVTSSADCLSQASATSNAIALNVETPPALQLGADTGFCSGAGVLLQAGNFATYTWSNGAVTPSIQINTAGTYSLVAQTLFGCVLYDTIQVSAYPTPQVALGPDVSLCEGSTRTLDAGSFSNYNWSNGANTRTIQAGQQGNYSVSVTDNKGCTGTGSVNVMGIMPLPSGFLPADTSICSYGSIQLKPINVFNAYLWSNGQTSPALTITTPGTYWLEVKDENDCKGKDSIYVELKECMKGIYIPSAFSPNNDGKNDNFRPLLFGNIKQYNFKIFNRWGNLVFQSKELLKGWDGMQAGKKQNAGVYIWTCTFQLGDEPIQTEKGTVLLIR